jgi:hypothetical protein
MACLTARNFDSKDDALTSEAHQLDLFVRHLILRRVVIQNCWPLAGSSSPFWHCVTAGRLGKPNAKNFSAFRPGTALEMPELTCAAVIAFLKLMLKNPSRFGLYAAEIAC